MFVRLNNCRGIVGYKLIPVCAGLDTGDNHSAVKSGDVENDTLVRSNEVKNSLLINFLG